MTTVSNLASALAAHRFERVPVGLSSYQGCSCGWLGTEGAGRWDAHAAKAIAALLPAPEPDATAQALRAALEDAAIDLHDREFWHDSNRTHARAWFDCTDPVCAERRALIAAPKGTLA